MALRWVPERAPDAGFSLVEMVVSIAVISVVMGALTTFLVTSLSAINQQRSKQTAIQLASSGIEQVRALKGSVVAAGHAGVAWDRSVPGVARYLAEMKALAAPPSAPPASAPLPTTAEEVRVNGVAYQRYWYVGECWQARTGGACTATPGPAAVKLLRVVVAVTWPGPERWCGRAACAYLTSTLVSAVPDEPVFNPNRAEPPKIVEPGDQAGDRTVAVGLELVATGGQRPLTWSVASPLPADLTMSAGGVISGKPKTAGAYPVTVVVTDAAGAKASATFTWTVNELPKLSKPGDQTSAAGNPVSLPMPLTGGTAPLTWEAKGLPDGLAIDPATGVVTGTPTKVAAAKTVTVTVTDRDKQFASTTFTWKVIPRPTIDELVGGRTNRVGDRVSLPVTATGGTGTYTWSAANLPAGLSIDAATGLISGTVTAGTRYLSTVTVTDQAGAAHSVTVEWRVDAPDGPRVTAPADDRTDTVGQAVTTMLSAAGGRGTGYAWSVSGLPPGVTATGATVSGVPVQAGAYVVTVTVRDGAGRVATFMYTWTIR
ncbi:putative Ig domain-containing protein [Planosporangium sp. 12N6]|uniref:Ig domain-containing protein n=1 Tax=Planosporangium spinosum TaxID=3402278 RepID=UPI003CFAA72D